MIAQSAFICKFFVLSPATVFAVGENYRAAAWRFLFIPTIPPAAARRALRATSRACKFEFLYFPTGEEPVHAVFLF